MKPSALAICLAVSSAVFTVNGALAADAVPALQSDSYPAIEQLLKDRKFDEALAATTKAASDNPRSARAFFLLGKTQFYREQDQAARAAFGKAIELAPTFADAYFFRGLTFNYGPQRELGGADFKRATELDATKARYWYELGRYSEHVDKNETATSAYEKAAALDPKMATAWYALGTLANRKQEYQAAAMMWEKALANDPKIANAHFNLGLHHQLRGNASSSLWHFLAAAEQQPDNVDTLKKVVQAYFRLGDFEKADSSRLKLFNLIAKSDDPTMRAMKEVCIDQFDAPGGRFFVYETISKEGTFFTGTPSSWWIKRTPCLKRSTSN